MLELFKKYFLLCKYTFAFIYKEKELTNIYH